MLPTRPLEPHALTVLPHMLPTITTCLYPYHYNHTCIPQPQCMSTTHRFPLNHNYPHNIPLHAHYMPTTFPLHAHNTQLLPTMTTCIPHAICFPLQPHSLTVLPHMLPTTTTSLYASHYNHMPPQCSHTCITLQLYACMLPTTTCFPLQPHAFAVHLPAVEVQ